MNVDDNNFFAYNCISTIPISVIELHDSEFNNKEKCVYSCLERPLDKDPPTQHI